MRKNHAQKNQITHLIAINRSNVSPGVAGVIDEKINFIRSLDMTDANNLVVGR